MLFGCLTGDEGLSGEIVLPAIQLELDRIEHDTDKITGEPELELLLGERGPPVKLEKLGQQRGLENSLNRQDVQTSHTSGQTFQGDSGWRSLSRTSTEAHTSPSSLASKSLTGPAPAIMTS